MYYNSYIFGDMLQIHSAPSNTYTDGHNTLYSKNIIIYYFQ